MWLCLGRRQGTLYRELLALLWSPQHFFPERNRTDLLKKITSICNYWLVIIFQKGKLGYACWTTIPGYRCTWQILPYNIHFITLSQTKLLEQVINKSMTQFKTLHAFSFIWPHTTLMFSFYFSVLEVEGDSHWDLIYHPKAMEEGCPRSSSASSSCTQTLHTPALCTPACIATNLQVLSNSSSCTKAITVFSPLLEFWRLPLLTFYCMASVGGATGLSTWHSS